MFTKSLTARHNLNLNFTELILTELKAFALRLKPHQQLHMNCCLMLTRLSYFAIRKIDELSPPIGLEDWIQICQALVPKTVKSEGETTSSGRSTKSKRKAKEEEKKSYNPII